MKQFLYIFVLYAEKRYSVGENVVQFFSQRGNVSPRVILIKYTKFSLLYNISQPNFASY